MIRSMAAFAFAAAALLMPGLAVPAHAADADGPADTFFNDSNCHLVAEENLMSCSSGRITYDTVARAGGSRDETSNGDVTTGTMHSDGRSETTREVFRTDTVY